MQGIEYRSLNTTTKDIPSMIQREHGEKHK